MRSIINKNVYFKVLKSGYSNKNVKMTRDKTENDTLIYCRKE